MMWYQLKHELALEYYGGKCAVCEAPFTVHLNPVFHHFYYLDDDARYKDFDTSEDYAYALAWYIIDNPDRFCALCYSCHQSVTRLSYYRDKTKIDNLYKVLSKTC